MTTEQKAKKRIAELEEEIFVAEKAYDHFGLKLKRLQAEQMALRTKFGLFIEIDKHVADEYKNKIN